MQAPSNNSNNSNNNNNSTTTAGLNPFVSVQERTIIIENIKKFLIEHLPADQVTSPQKAHELAVRFENHVALNTSTKEQYQGMIAEKLRMIKSKSTEPSPALQSQSAQSLQSINTATTTSNNTNTVTSFSAQEMAQISSRLQQIRPQIPQIDKLLSLHSKLATPPPHTLEMVKKLTDCRNVLVNQIESAQAKRSFGMNLGQLNLLIEQVQRLFNSLVAKMKESAGVSPALSTAKTTTTTSINTTGASTNTTNPSSMSSSSASINSSSLSATTTAKRPHKTQPSNTNEFEKILLQRLALPPDEPQREPPSWMQRFISFNSARKPAFKPTNLKHLKQRNRLLQFELKQLQSLTKTVQIQENGLGVLSLLITCKGHRFIFQISQKYPYDQLIYRIEPLKQHKAPAFLLPRHLEPKTFPLTVSTILKNFKE